MTMTSSGVDTTYNGWTSYNEWNIALYVANEYNLYCIARECETYQDFLDMSGVTGTTPDGVKWNNYSLNSAELDEMIKEM